MRRSLPLLTAATFAMAACSDSAVAPSRAKPSAETVSAPAMFERSIGNPDVGRSSVLVIPVAGGSAQAGLFTLSFEPNAVACVQEVAGADCVPPSGDVVVYASVRVKRGSYAIEFSPHVEFKPGTAVLSTDAFAPLIRALVESGVAADSPVWNMFAIRNQGPKDGIRTVVNLKDGSVSREIDHFSGYIIGAGCDPLVDPTCSRDISAVGVISY